MGNLATVFESESRFTEAEELYKQTLAAYERQFGSNHPLAAIALNNLAKPHR
jgi:hypothetical protein